MTQQHPDFKAGFKYQNIGNIVGTLNYAKEMKKQDGSVFGWEFLLNARGFGSINVRIPMLDRAQNSLDNFPISDKPRVRAGLSRIEQFLADSGRLYTNATTFVELSEAVTVSGEPMKDNIAGRVAGEIFNISQIQGENGPALKFQLVTFPVQRDDESKRAMQQNGTPVDPQVLTLEAHDPNVVGQIQQTVRNGSNVEVGYKYFNKQNVQYDDYGFAINDPNSVIERLECGKIVVHGAPQAPQGQGFGGFGNNPQGGFGNPQGGGFGAPQGGPQFPGGPFNQNNIQPQGAPDFSGSQNNFGVKDNQMPFDPSYQQPPQQQGFGNDPFAGNGQVLPPNDPFAQQANQFFGGGNPQGGFGFGN